MARLDFGDACIEFEGRIDEAVRSCGRFVDAYVYLVDGRPVPSDSSYSGEVTVSAFRVASGG